MRGVRDGDRRDTRLPRQPRGVVDREETGVVPETIIAVDHTRCRATGRKRQLRIGIDPAALDPAHVMNQQTDAVAIDPAQGSFR